MKAPETVSLAYVFQVLEKTDPILVKALVDQGLDPESSERLDCHVYDDEGNLIIMDMHSGGAFFGLIVPDPDYIPF